LKQVLRLQAVEQATGLSAPTIYRAIRRGDFPRQVRLSPGCVGWIDADVQAWVESRLQGPGRSPTRSRTSQGDAAG
jgi:prophage regulatory protein